MSALHQQEATIVSCKMPVSEHDALKRRAIELDCSVSRLIRQAVRRDNAELDDPPRETRS